MDTKEKEALKLIKVAQREAVDAAVQPLLAQAEQLIADAQKSEQRITELETKLNKAESKVEIQQQHLDKLDIAGQHRRGAKEVSIRAELDKNQESILKAINMKNVGIHTRFEIKAVDEPMITNTIAGDAQQLFTREVDGGIHRAPKLQHTILTYANVRPTNARIIEWVNRESGEGNAQFIGQGELKPLRSFTFTHEDSKPKKVAVAFKVTTESLQDIEILAEEIRADGFEAIEDAINSKLLSADGSDAQEPLGVLVQAAAFNVTGLAVHNPNNYDAIVAGALQISQLRHFPDVAFVNSTDFTNMALSKGEDGHYTIPLFASKDGERIQIALVRVVISDEIQIGYVLIGDMRKFNIRPLSGYFVEIGTEDKDLRLNLRTIVVERRLHAYIKKHDKTAFLYDSFANIKAGILKE